jgi:hypothetical protein
MRDRFSRQDRDHAASTTWTHTMKKFATPRHGALAVLLLALAATVGAQEHLATWLGETSSERFGVVAVLGDVDLDGTPDHAIGAPENNGQRGRVRVVSGATGFELWRVSGTLDGDLMGFSVAGAGDVDADGIPDVVIGLPGAEGTNLPGRVQVRSGLDGALIQEELGTQPGGGFGHSVGSVGDVDLDGRSDILVGAPFEDGPAGVDTGAVYALAGGDGHMLAIHQGSLAGDLFGFTMQGSIKAGDGSPEPVIGSEIDSGDGGPEPVIGAPQPDNGGEGYAVELSLVDFSEVRRHVGAQPGDRFGASVGLVGDANGDGVSDLIVGADPRDAAGLPAGSGYARVYGGDGALIHEFADSDGTDGFGAAVAGVGDVNGDGRDDLAVGAPESDGDGWAGANAGTVRIYDGDDGALLHVIHGAAGSGLGRHVAFAGDLDADGLADCAVGAPADISSGIDSGSVFVFSLARWTNLYGGVPGTGGVPALAGTGETSAASTVELALSGARADANAALVAGTALIYDAGLGLFVPNGEIEELGLSTDAQGELVHELQLPAGLPTGAVLYYQFVVDDQSAPEGQARSNTVAGHAP